MQQQRTAAAAASSAAAVLTKDPSALIRGIELQNQGRVAEAEALFRSYLITHPADGAALYSLAVILLQRSDHAQAVELLSNGVLLCPTFAPLWMAYAGALQALGRFTEALASYDKALAINPDYTEVLLNSGVLLRDQQRHLEALERFKRVLEIKPDHEAAMGNSGIILTEFKRSDEAIAMFERLLAVNPNYDYGHGLLAYERLHACDWTGFAESAAKIISGIKARQRSCKSLPLMAFSDDCADHQISAQIFAERFPVSKKPLWTGERYGHKKIRLAYVSPDLREHPVGHLMAGIFEHHDKSRFETVAISLGIDDKSRLRSRMLAAFDKFIDARAMTSRQIAELMREMEIDVVVDLAGYTADSRTDVFAHRPVPAQANFLGYPGTMGTSYMDYIIADKHVIPPEHQPFYNEKVVYLPDAYLPTDASVKISERTPTRQECGLPDTGVVFCSFSHDYKINPPLFDIWMRLLAQVPGSVLWLMSRSQISQANLRKEAQQRGIDPARLVFAGRVPLVEDHMARYRQADIFLDTHPYNAHTTAADALMAGLPVVTYKGGAFPARVAASLLHAVGMPELVTNSAQEYEALALKLATHPDLLAATKARLAERKVNTPLFDTAGFCRNLEDLYTTMWRQSEGLPVEVAQPPALKTVMQQAQDVFDQGNLHKADLLCRYQLTEEPGNVPALLLLSRVAERIGAHDFQARYLQAAGVAVPAPAPVVPAPAAGEARYMLIKAWGFGFWSDLDHVYGGLLTAELTGRTPIVHWGTNSLFRGPDTDNAFESFFEPVSSVRWQDVVEPGLSYFPAKWNADNLRQEDHQKWAGEHSRMTTLYALNRPENVVVSDFHTMVQDLIPWIPPSSPYFGLERSEIYHRLFKKFIQLKPHLQQRVDEVWNTQMANDNWLAVHVRGTDKVHEIRNLDDLNEVYAPRVDNILKINPTLRVFLLTDSEQVVTQFKERYGDRVLSMDCQRGTGIKGVHLEGHPGTLMGEQVILDAFLAARCDFFLGNGGSNVSTGIRHLKSWPQGMFFLVGPDVLGTFNLMLHNW